MIHVLGDSHVMLFTGQKLPYLIQPPVDFKPMGYDLRKGYVTYFCVLLRAYRMIDNHYFWELMGHIPKNSTVILVVGEIDCRGPILNEAHRQGFSVEAMAEECVNRYLMGVRKIAEMGLNPIIFAPYAQKNICEIKDGWVMLPGHLDAVKWCEQKSRAVAEFEKHLRRSSFPVISLNKWMNKNKIHDSDEYWADQIHLSEKVWPFIEEEMVNIYVGS